MEYSPAGELPKEIKLPKPSYLRLKGEQAKQQAKECRDYIDAQAMYEHEYQIRKYTRWRRADLFKQAVQWLQKSFNSEAGVSMHYAPLSFKSDEDPDYIPTPVYDEFSAPINNEAARLGRPEYKPYVRPRGERPNAIIRTGAKRGEEVLDSMLRDMRWPEQQELGNLAMPLYGGWYLLSYWDQSWEKTTKLPVDGAVRCPECKFKLASPELSEKQAQPFLDRDSVKPKVEVAENGDPKFSYEATECLTCEPKTSSRVEVVDDGMGGMTPTVVETTTPVPALEPFTPVDQELEQNDHFGRPLGEDVPLGEWKLKTLSPYDVFLPNLGIDVSPSDIGEFTYIHVESLDWIRNRYENGRHVKPESHEALMKYHPIAGERAVYHSAGLHGMRLFTKHCRVKEIHKKPWREEVFDERGECVGLKMNRGRSVIMAGDVLLFDGDYLMESKVNPGKFIARVSLDYATNEPRSGGREFDGMSMAERMFDPCMNGNEIHSQVQDARVHEGSPKWRVTRGMNLDYETSGGAGSRVVWDVDPSNPDKEPEQIGNNLLNAGVWEELRETIGFISRSSNLTETERGQPPTGITAALALQFLQEQSGEQRRPRIRAIREMLMRAFSHGLALCHELVREPRLYWTKDDSGSWSEKSWKGTDLAGQTDVQIDPEPDHDTDLQRQQRIMDFIRERLMEKNPKLARKVARKMHVDEDLFQEENLQDETAEREYCEWIKYDKEPVVDDDLDAHDAHYEKHGVDAMSEEFRDLEDESGWDLVVPLLSGWKDQFNDSQQPVDVSAVPPPAPGEVPPPPPQPITVPGFDTLLKQKGVFSLEARILQTWNLIAQKAMFAPEPGTEQALMKVMRFRAHMAAHRLLGERQMQQAAMGQQVMAAPEAPDQTRAGTVAAAQGVNATVAA
jgi:hypothetical protein